MSWAIADACNTNTGKAEAGKLRLQTKASLGHTAKLCVHACTYMRERLTEGKTERLTEKYCVGHIVEACYPDYIQALAQKQNFRSCFVLVLEIEPGTSNTLYHWLEAQPLKRMCKYVFFSMFTAEPDFCLRTLKQ